MKSDQELAALLGLRGAAINWIQFPESVLIGYKMLKANPESLRWGMHLFVYTADKMLVGIGGYKGVADAAGMVEIGYAIAPEYQSRGLATEAARGLVREAFSHPFVKMVDAHTLAEWNASTGVLKNCGMTKIGEKSDPEDGDIWHWRLMRNSFDTQ